MDSIDINKIEFEQEERIMRFLRGNMSKEDELEFKKELQKNSEFKEKAITMARLAKGLSQVGAENDKLIKDTFLSADEESIRRIAREAMKSDVATKTVKFRKRFATILSLAASVLIIVYLGGDYYTSYKKTVGLGNAYAVAFQPDNYGEARGIEEEGVKNEVGQLINNVYNNEDLKQSLKRLSALWDLSTQDTYNDYSDYAFDIGWALATGYLKDNNKKEALSVLSKLFELFDENSYEGIKVRKLLEEFTSKY